MSKKRKKKKSKSRSGDPQSQLHSLSLEQLLERGERFIKADRPRDAVSVLKFAVNKHGLTEPLQELLFRAYTVRESQLRDKGMIAEADSVKKNARGYMPSLDQIDEGAFVAYLQNASNADAFGLYARYLDTRDRIEAAERFLANRLLNAGCWDLIEPLDFDSPLVADVGALKRARPLMEAGDWAGALSAMAPVGRHSPYAPIRIFCRAMAAFCAGDDAAANRALASVPEDFSLIGVAREMQTVLNGAGGGPDAVRRAKEAKRRLGPLWDGPVGLDSDARALIRALNAEQVPEARRRIEVMADALHPEDPGKVRWYLAEVIFNMVIQDRIGMPVYSKLIRGILSEKDVDLLKTKTTFLSSPNPFETVGDYLSRIDRELPDPASRDLGHAMVLRHLVSGLLHRTGWQSDPDVKRAIRKHQELLGTAADDPDRILIEMADKSITLDPDNRDGYLLLARLPRPGRPPKQMVEKRLLEMAERFPDDPHPCLELAKLYYESGAFRKAETILQDAMERAPHDSRVIDRHVLALLYSAQKNMGRKKWHLVERDLDRAEGLEARRAALLVVEKRMLLDMIRDGVTFPDTAKAHLSDRPLIERIQILAYLTLELPVRDFWGVGLRRKELAKQFKATLKEARQLPSDQLARLMMPLEQDFGMVLPTTRMAEAFLDGDRNFLRHLEDGDALAVYETIFERAYFDPIRRDINRRRKSARGKSAYILQFYRLLLDAIEKKRYSSKPFHDLLDGVPDGVREELRRIGRRVAPQAEGPLRHALETFHFEVLDFPMPRFPFGPLFDFDDDDDDDDIDEMDERDLIQALIDQMGDQVGDVESETVQVLGEIISELEEMVDDLGFRGVPNSIILEARGDVRSHPQVRKELDDMARIIREAGAIDHLSREARIILFGRKKVKK